MTVFCVLLFPVLIPYVLVRIYSLSSVPSVVILRSQNILTGIKVKYTFFFNVLVMLWEPHLYTIINPFQMWNKHNNNNIHQAVKVLF